MRTCRSVLAVLALATMATPSHHASASPTASDLDPGSNAALQYWQAFALLPPVDPGQDKLPANWREAQLDEAARKLADGFEGSRKYLLRASRLRACDWGLEYQDGMFLQLPYLAKARTLANLAALHARTEFERGRWASGAEDVRALLRLARHLEAEPIMIVQMVGFAVEAAAVDAAAPFLKAGGPALTGPLVEAIETLPGRPTVSQVILKEKQVCVAGLVHRLKEAEAREAGSWRGVWQPLEGDTAAPVTTFEQAVATAESMAPYYDRLAEEAALPWPDFNPIDGAYPPRLKAANRLAYVFMASLVDNVGAERRARTRLELFRAAIGVARDGPDALRTIKDPAGDGGEPFRYRELGEGTFRLSSRLPDAPSSRLGPRPVAVTVGKEPAVRPAKGQGVK